MGDFIEVARLDEVPPGKGTVVTVAQGRGGVHMDGTIYAMENSCRHQGLSLGTEPAQNFYS